VTASACDVAIVGGGFSGALLAAHMLTDRAARPGRVLLVDRAGRFGRGIAYSTPNQRHLLNVPAGSMSAFVDRPDHFLAWARKRIPDVDRGSFLPRTLYGDYVASVLDDAIRHPAHGSSIELRIAAVRRLEPGRGGTPGVHLHLDDGDVSARRVVLATGNAASRRLAVPGLEDPLTKARYVPDPWAPGVLDPLPGAGDVLVLGTGLTLIDVALDLASRGHRGRVVALSRRGLLPQAHRTTPVAAGKWLDGGAFAAPLTASRLVRAVRRAAEAAAAAGGDWRSVIAELRSMTPALWTMLGDPGRGSFLRHAAPYWETHRHRVAPAVDDVVCGLLASGQLVVRAASLVSLEGHRGFVNARIQPRGGSRRETLAVSTVVNCTGPDPDVRNSTDPLLAALLASGAIRGGPCSLGIDVDESGAVISRAGTPSRVLFALGPLRRGRLYETTAVPEIRGQAIDLARRLGATLAR
jgi:uncharacterized NAD(P)/FAD-binding protein YdhS